MYYLKYKNYYTCIHYSKEDQLFYGKLEGINDLINFEGQTLEKIEAEFKQSVEDYLIFCNDINKISDNLNYIPKILKNNVIVNLNKSFRDNPFRKVIGYDKEKEKIIIRGMNKYYYYNGLSIEEIDEDWDNNLDEILEKINNKKILLKNHIDFIENLRNIFSNKFLNGYCEIISQLKYFENINSQYYYKYYVDSVKELKKGKRRKEKYMHRFLTDEEIEKIKEILNVKEYLGNDSEKYQLKDLESIEEELKKYS